MCEEKHPKVYHLSPRRRRILFGIWLSLTVTFVGGGWYSSDHALIVVGAVVGSIMGVIFGITGWWYPRLSVGAGGITLHQIGWRLATSWENIAAMRLDRGSEGLILRKPMDCGGARRLETMGNASVGGAPFYGPEQSRLIAEKRFIPLEPFSYWFEHGDLLDEMALHAPWIKDGAEGQGRLVTSDVVRPDGRPRFITIVKVGAIVILAVGVGLAGEMGSQRVQSFVHRGVSLAIGLAVGIYSLSNARSAFLYFRERRFGAGLLWGGIAILQALLVLMLLGWALEGR